MSRPLPWYTALMLAPAAPAISVAGVPYSILAQCAGLTLSLILALALPPAAAVAAPLTSFHSLALFRPKPGPVLAFDHVLNPWLIPPLTLHLFLSLPLRLNSLLPLPLALAYFLFSPTYPPSTLALYPGPGAGPALATVLPPGLIPPLAPLLPLTLCIAPAVASVLYPWLVPTLTFPVTLSFPLSLYLPLLVPMPLPLSLLLAAPLPLNIPHPRP